MENKNTSCGQDKGNRGGCACGGSGNCPDCPNKNK